MLYMLPSPPSSQRPSEANSHVSPHEPRGADGGGGTLGTGLAGGACGGARGDGAGGGGGAAGGCTQAPPREHVELSLSQMQGASPT